MEVVDTPSLEVFQDRLDGTLSNLLCCTERCPCFFQPKTFYDSLLVNGDLEDTELKEKESRVKAFERRSLHCVGRHVSVVVQLLGHATRGHPSTASSHASGAVLHGCSCLGMAGNELYLLSFF